MTDTAEDALLESIRAQWKATYTGKRKIPPAQFWCVKCGPMTGWDAWLSEEHLAEHQE